MNWHLFKEQATSVYEAHPAPLTARATNPPVPSSDELVDHHVLLHPCDGSHGSTEIWCQCGNALLVFCNECDMPLFLIVRPGTWCEHAQGAWEDLA